ncbi:MAG TPA: aldo/keto reductase [Pirellulaceae bacterium]|jgi:diketogulonate reductase-like aldo/keto reductase|nr:aldo/keto reductase [Pirellulaceae bacterium]
MNDSSTTIDATRVPRLLYGTAWKEDSTEELVARAIASGFRGIDTANQRKHYHEAAVGRAVTRAIERGDVSRSELFLQTKCTFRAGQDERLPYDPGAPIATQVEQSLTSSLAHLGADFVDSYVLHAPSQRRGLGAADLEARRAMEEAVDSGRVRLLGVSNVGPEQLIELCDVARIPPRFVQNRCFARDGWDRRIRGLCVDRGIVYQGFSLLTANPAVLADSSVVDLAESYGRSAAQIVFWFALDVGMLPLTGTSDERHMREDLGILDFRLTPDEIERVEAAAER